jgi:hypothetical protein
MYLIKYKKYAYIIFFQSCIIIFLKKSSHTSIHFLQNHHALQYTFYKTTMHFNTLYTKLPRTSIQFLQNHHALQYTFYKITTHFNTLSTKSPPLQYTFYKITTHFNTLYTKLPRTSIQFVQIHHALQYTSANAALVFELRR